MAKNKQQLKEDLNRFKQILGYNPSKGLIKEEGEQLSMDFPSSLNHEEQEVIDNLNKLLEYIGKNLPKKGETELFQNYQYDYLKGDISDLINAFENGKAYISDAYKKFKEKHPKPGKQLSMDLSTSEEITSPEEFITLMESVINKLESMETINRYPIRLGFILDAFKQRLEGESTTYESDFYIDDEETEI